MSYRLGLIHYTNVAPLTEKLILPADTIALTGTPTEMNAALLSGEVDLANISAIEFIQHADRLGALRDFSVSVLGAVYSVNLFHKCPWEELNGARIALTSQSATSVKLLDLLLQEDGIKVQFEQAEGKATSLLNAGFDGVLRIGDCALREWYDLVGPINENVSMLDLSKRRSGTNGVIVTDLAQKWYGLTGAPFVFAVWAYSLKRPPPIEVQQALKNARRWGIGHLAEIAKQHGIKLGLPERVVQHYLWNFRYHLETPDLAGLAEFARRVAPEHAPLAFS